MLPLWDEVRPGQHSYSMDEDPSPDSRPFSPHFRSVLFVKWQLTEPLLQLFIVRGCAVWPTLATPQVDHSLLTADRPLNFSSALFH